MLKVGLTGGIACGKTTVLEIFASLGAHTLRADLVGHQLMAPGAPLYSRIVAAFGAGTLLIALMSAWGFGRFNGGNPPGGNGKSKGV